MGGRHVVITCDSCGHKNRMERPIEDGETRRLLICEHCESLIVADLTDLSRDFRPNAPGKRGA